MADTKISDMPAATSVTGSDVVPVVQGGVNKKVTFTVQQALWDGHYQPLDADLTALAALAGTHTIYYRSAANTWSAVTIGTGLDFTGATLSSTVTSGAPTNAHYVTNQAESGLSAEINLGALTTGFLLGTVSAGVSTISSVGSTGTGNVVLATSPTLVTPVLGTPTSGTLTTCTGYTVANLVGDTSTALGVGSIELGNATDTTLSRNAAGVLQVEGVVVPTISSTNTLTNKRNTPRVLATNAPGATPSINTDNYDAVSLTGINAAITSMTTNLSGTPVNFDKLIIRFKDDGTARAITWGSSFEAKGVALPTTTVLSKVLTVGFIYDTVTSKWGCVASAQEA